ncbi:hypothetical protein MPTK1_5g19320 [Marchantia polymorpha subsp. ruderalis]|uniref:Uncharacterized protein n=2 Tax=Marchantia polymorpha TaxID=3197 RepID=A0AAF6BK11_MARPO|nr:hypothetical protein MARPO_0073s0012 [Marchantia polymorpha]BBN12345.1 hypothetical protein Mp_5g19320 [Marchantia polymorpha subsp. ruderalis]|eukprot:PTQ35132.1 hypothetical protein MARPO_0073s0012 [Marchantia polymorpha]
MDCPDFSSPNRCLCMSHEKFRRFLPDRISQAYILVWRNLADHGRKVKRRLSGCLTDLQSMFAFPCFS